MKMFSTLLLLIYYPIVLVGQSTPAKETRRLCYDENGLLSITDTKPLNFEDKLTEFGEISYRLVTKQAGPKEVEIWLLKQDSTEEKLWSPALWCQKSHWQFRFFKNIILEEDFFSFLIATHNGLEWVRCEKNTNGLWQESDRIILYRYTPPGFRTFRMEYILSDKNNLIVKMVLIRNNLGTKKTTHFEWIKEGIVLENGKSLNHNANHLNNIRELQKKQWEIIKKY